MSEIGFDSFFQLIDPSWPHAIRVRIDDQEWNDINRLRPLFRGCVQKDSSRLPLKLKVFQGRHYYDFLWSATTQVQCISDRFITFLTEGRFTGWSTYKIVMLDRKNKACERYHGLAVLGRAGDFDPTRTVRERFSNKWGGFTDMIKGYYFLPQTWDHTDIFLAGGYTFVTKHLKDAIEREGFKNLLFRPQKEVEVRELRK